MTSPQFYGVAQRDDKPYDWTETLGEKLYWSRRFERLTAERDARQNRLALINAHVAQGLSIERATATVDAYQASQAPPPRRGLLRRLAGG
jgi:hypothetical protein